jgi:hypothetical protein
MKLFTAAYDAAADIRSTTSPAVVLKVTSQTELAGMQLGGADLNNRTRFVDPVVGGHVAAATGTVVVVVVVVVEVVLVVVVVGVAVFEPLFTANTMRTIATAAIPR